VENYNTDIGTNKGRALGAKPPPKCP